MRAFLLRNLAEVPSDAALAQEAIAQERMLKIMSAHVTIQPSGHEFLVEGDGYLAGSGAAQWRVAQLRLQQRQLRRLQGAPGVGRSQESACPRLCVVAGGKDAGMILLCSYAPVHDVVIEANVAGARDIPVQKLVAKVKSVEVFNPQMAALHILAPRSQRLRFLGGQSIQLGVDGVTGRYAIASCPCEDRHIEVQIPRLAGDAFAERGVCCIARQRYGRSGRAIWRVRAG